MLEANPDLPSTGCGDLTPLHFAFRAALGSTSISGARNVETELFVFTVTVGKLKFPRCPFILVVFDLKNRKIQVGNWIYRSWVTGTEILCSWCDAEMGARKTFGRISMVFFRFHSNI